MKKMIKLRLIALDGKPITPRTGRSEVIALVKDIPYDGTYHSFLYHNEDCESPGVMIDIHDLTKKTKDEYFFKDLEGRSFKMIIINDNFIE